MPVIVAFTIGLVFWIIGWALGAKPFDAFLITILILLVATGWHIAGPHVKRLLQGDPDLS